MNVKAAKDALGTAKNIQQDVAKVQVQTDTNPPVANSKSSGEFVELRVMIPSLLMRKVDVAVAKSSCKYKKDWVTQVLTHVLANADA